MSTPDPIIQERVRELLTGNKFEQLLEVFEPDQVHRLTSEQRWMLAGIFYEAAVKLRHKLQNVVFSSLYCERGLMLVPKHQPLLRLQIKNYLHLDMKLYAGAEELALALIEVDPDSVENQLLRGKVAFEQGEYDVAVVWLNKAARAGRGQSGPLVEEAWHLLGLAQGKQKEIKSALSMTRELEAMLARTGMPQKAAVGSNNKPKDSFVPAGGSITLYITTWCPYCRKARKLLQGMNVKFEEKDIEKDQDALMEMMRYAEEAGVEVSGVPVLRIGNELVVGYNPQRIGTLIQQIR